MIDRRARVCVVAFLCSCGTGAEAPASSSEAGSAGDATANDPSIDSVDSGDSVDGGGSSGADASATTSDGEEASGDPTSAEGSTESADTTDGEIAGLDFPSNGDAPILRHIKIFDRVLSEDEMLIEADEEGVVAPGIWYRKIDPRPDDLLCDSGTGREFAWADPQNTAALWTGSR